jgi:hypothetical protein
MMMLGRELFDRAHGALHDESHRGHEYHAHFKNTSPLATTAVVIGVRRDV